MTRIGAVMFLLALAACDRGYSRSGDAAAHDGGGEVSLSDGGSLSYAITSERYKQWEAARRGIDRRVSRRFGEILQPSAPSERSISRATAYLLSEPQARASIELAGMSVRSFVEMTVALEQEMRLASARGEAPQPEAMPMPYPVPIDTVGIAPVQAAPVPPYGVDTLRRADTGYSRYAPPYPVRRDTVLPSTDTLRRLDTLVRRARDSVVSPRRDTLVPRRDTLVQPRRDTLSQRGRDSLAAPRPSRDTLRDTLANRRNR